jgi:hypothetical protein
MCNDQVEFLFSLFFTRQGFEKPWNVFGAFSELGIIGFSKSCHIFNSFSV